MSMRITPQDFAEMTDQERESYIMGVIGMTQQELARTVAEWEYEHGKTPNAIFLSMEILIELRMSAGITLRKLLRNKLTVIPMDSDRETFILALEDPWDWGNLFYM